MKPQSKYIAIFSILPFPRVSGVLFPSLNDLIVIVLRDTKGYIRYFHDTKEIKLLAPIVDSVLTKTYNTKNRNQLYCGIIPFGVQSTKNRILRIKRRRGKVFKLISKEIHNAQNTKNRTNIRKTPQS